VSPPRRPKKDFSPRITLLLGGGGRNSDTGEAYINFTYEGDIKIKNKYDAYVELYI
jgi:hypothetical protein